MNTHMHNLPAIFIANLYEINKTALQIDDAYIVLHLFVVQYTCKALIL